MAKRDPLKVIAEADAAKRRAEFQIMAVSAAAAGLTAKQCRAIELAPLLFELLCDSPNGAAWPPHSLVAARDDLAALIDERRKQAAT